MKIPRPVWFIHGARNGREHAMGAHVRGLVLVQVVGPACQQMKLFIPLIWHHEDRRVYVRQEATQRLEPFLGEPVTHAVTLPDSNSKQTRHANIAIAEDIRPIDC